MKKIICLLVLAAVMFSCTGETTVAKKVVNMGGYDVSAWLEGNNNHLLIESENGTIHSTFKPEGNFMSQAGDVILSDKKIFSDMQLQLVLYMAIMQDDKEKIEQMEEKYFTFATFTITIETPNEEQL
jgi:hypothetical protein